MMKLPKANYKFTDKKIPPLSVMGAVLAVISLVTLTALLIISFLTAGQIEMKLGITTLMCLIFSLVSVVFSIRTLIQKNVFHVLAIFGLVVSSVNLLFLMYIYGLGVMG